MEIVDFNVENARIQMRKGLLEFPILLIVADGEVYASDILQQLKKADLIVVEGTLYPLLSRLKKNGLLEYVWRESKSGPPRKYYKLTQEGEKVLNELLETWNVLSSSINKLKKTYEKSS
ncbi:PadR family transcriptional regulator [Candidatus Kaiserbacteria bacterium]|nr:MAG: PadR family transcriptional regulator [Candidatus Kaiserbacteria bacterium]